MSRFRGLFPVLQTPFDENGEIDFDSLRRLIQHVSEQGIQGIVFPGFASEWWRLTADEIEECASLIGPLAILNVTAQATVPALRQARSLVRRRPQALMILPPFVIPQSVAGHLEAVIGAVELPCIIQDSAGLTAVRLTPAAVASITRRHNNLAGIKVDQVPTGPGITSFRAEPALRDLSYFVGYSGVQMLDAVRRGAEALMGGCGHLREDRKMLDDLAAGGDAEYRRLLPLLNFEMQTLDMVISMHKHLLFEQGVIGTPLCRQPCSVPDNTHLEELQIHIEALRR